MTVQVFEFLDRTAPTGLGDTKAQVGQIVLEGNRLTFNGQALTDPALDAVAAACRDQLGRGHFSRAVAIPKTKP